MRKNNFLKNYSYLNVYLETRLASYEAPVYPTWQTTLSSVRPHILLRAYISSTIPVRRYLPLTFLFDRSKFHWHHQGRTIHALVTSSVKTVLIDTHFSQYLYHMLLFSCFKFWRSTARILFLLTNITNHFTNYFQKYISRKLPLFYLYFIFVHTKDFSETKFLFYHLTSQQLPAILVRSGISQIITSAHTLPGRPAPTTSLWYRHLG